MTQQLVSGWQEPVPSRPHIPGYGIPESEEGVLPWAHVTERLRSARTYWVATAGPDGRPHSTPIWGGFVDGTLFFEGSPHTRRGRNLAANPAVVVHLESGDDVVIVEGTVQEIKGPDPSLAGRLVEDFAAKYEALGYRPSADQWNEGGLYAVQPQTVFAWTRFPQDATRFRFRDR